MNRTFLLVMLLSAAVLAGGCSAPPADTPTAAPLALTSPADYAEWPVLTPKPVRVPHELFLDCVSRPQQVDRGPHFAPVVKLYANPGAFQALRASHTAPLPVGSVIVKEKWWNETAAQPSAFAAMRKREPSYDPEHGDWEYVYVSLEGERKDERGRIESCRACHQSAAATDYLFRTHWKPETLAGGSP